MSLLYVSSYIMPFHDFSWKARFCLFTVGYVKLHILVNCINLLRSSGYFLCELVMLKVITMSFKFAKLFFYSFIFSTDPLMLLPG